MATKQSRPRNVPYAVDRSYGDHDDRENTQFNGGFNDIAHSIPLMDERTASRL